MPTTTTQHTISSNLSQGFNQRSSLVKELISAKPSFMVRWGIVIFFIIIALLGVLCWFIQYPDIVVTKATLNCTNAPKQVITRSEGKITKILIAENEMVKTGQTLAYMESIANPATVALLGNELKTILLNLDGLQKPQKYLEGLGELQQQYQTFNQAFITFKDYVNNGFYVRKKEMLFADYVFIKKQHNILTAQKTLLEQDLVLTNENFKANESLAKDKVISPVDFRNEKSKLISKQLSLPQINASIIANESQQNEKRKEIAELENQILIQKNIFNQALLTMQSQIDLWNYKYILKSPVAGIAGFSSFFQENQDVKVGTILFNVQPPNSTYFIEMQVPQYNFGKVHIGQEVLLKFQAYPFEQYGAVIGKIAFISTLPSDSGYLAKVILPNGFITNYKKPLLLKNGLTANAEIITQKMRLLERFYNNLTKQMQH